MELITIEFGLVFWTLYAILGLVALVHVLFLNNAIRGRLKFAWVLTILFLPVLGSFLYLAIGKKRIKTN